jgi:hypothetical protein
LADSFLAVRRLQHCDCHQNATDGALVGFAKKGHEQFGRCVGGAVGFADAVNPQENRMAALVQDGGKALGDKEQIALHQPDGNGVTGCFQDAKAGGLGDHLFTAALLLFGFECRIGSGPLLAGIVNRAIR